MFFKNGCKSNRYIRLCLMLTSLLAVPWLANAQGPPATLPAHEGVIEYATPPEDIADAIVTFVPDVDMPLHVPETVERPVRGRVVASERGVLRGVVPPGAILHRPNTMGAPLQAGVPVKLFLKRFPDRDAYYPIAVFPPSQGVRP